jgi:tellurite resistance protein TehA-like permease
MEEIFYTIGDFFQSIFEIMPLFGDYINYFYMVIIFTFLVLWTRKMIVHRKRGEEHASL